MIGHDEESEMFTFNRSEIRNGKSSRGKSRSFFDYQTFLDQNSTSVVRSILAITALISTLIFLVVFLIIPLFNAVNHPKGTLKTMDSGAKMGGHDHQEVACPSNLESGNHGSHEDMKMDDDHGKQEGKNMGIKNGKNNSETDSEKKNGNTSSTQLGQVEEGSSKMGKDLERTATDTDLTLDDNSDYRKFLKYATNTCKCHASEEEPSSHISQTQLACLYRCIRSCNMHTLPSQIGASEMPHPTTFSKSNPNPSRSNEGESKPLKSEPVSRN